ncbi:hypothetical protein J4230_03175 [Candidatus Woesearchaeota archaeon]|nr:hypothetical protein [Candidatus Woesearchaeota archaeon]
MSSKKLEVISTEWTEDGLTLFRLRDKEEVYIIPDRFNFTLGEKIEILGWQRDAKITRRQYIEHPAIIVHSMTLYDENGRRVDDFEFETKGALYHRPHA